MTFWNSQTLKQRLPQDTIVKPYSESQVKHGAYELLVGPEAFLTSTKKKVKKTLKEGAPFVIPPGQLAMLVL